MQSCLGGGQQGFGLGGQQGFGGQQGLGGGQQGFGLGAQQGYGGQQGLGGGQQGFGGQQGLGGGQQQGLAGQGQQGGLIGAGYGQRHVAPAHIQEQYRGKPAFFDSERGILWDGKTAHFYAPVGSAPSAQQSNLITAIETGPQGTRITLGNGTQGDLREHAMHPSSNYILDCQGLGL
uniref:Uncharacterized protein n=1 Tax=Panagrolaimus sp. PS1159 TaxID=55785 RepID=A0AC35F4P2_9BILA